MCSSNEGGPARGEHEPSGGVSSWFLGGATRPFPSKFSIRELKHGRRMHTCAVRLASRPEAVQGARSARVGEPVTRGDRDRDRRLVDMLAHERDDPHQARLLCLRLGAGRSDATLDERHTLRRAVSPQT